MSEFDKPKYLPWQVYLTLGLSCAAALAIPSGSWVLDVCGGIICVYWGAMAGIQYERTRPK